MFATLMGLPTITPKDLHARLGAAGLAIFDLNSEASFAAAHVPGARRLEPATFRDTDLPAGRDVALVFYCSNPLCRKAPNAARRARTLGYHDVRVMSAGISGWLNASLPTESGPDR